MYLKPVKLSRIVPTRNHVAVKLPPEVDSITTASGTKIFVDTSFDPDKYSSVYGDVIAMPKGDNRIKKGAKVYFHYLSVDNAKSWDVKGCYFEQGTDRIAILPFDTIFFDVLSAEVTMHNTWCLVDPLKSGEEEIIVDGVPIKIDGNYKGKLIALSTGINRKNEGTLISAPEGSNLKKGEVVYWSRESDVPLEFDLIRTFPQKCFRMKEVDIICKLVDGVATPYGPSVIIKHDPTIAEIRKRSKIWLPPDPKKRVVWGNVHSIGDKVTQVEHGDRVSFGNLFGTEIYVGGEPHTIVEEKFILTKNLPKRRSNKN